jgi:uncharacterized repeat protein (TIGR01451 family)
MSARRRAVVVAVVAGAAVAVGPTPVAEAGSSPQPTRLVTFVARTCSSYTDVAANRARNNIQESLQDLGADTLYNGGNAVSPVVEQTQQPNCAPLSDWRFTMGNGYTSRAVTGPWGALSVVTGPFAGDIVTRSSVPLLDRNGDDTGEALAGAVTVALTPGQVALAAKASSLWAQGGTPADPVLDQAYPGKFGFGALRCAVDILNGDNVEWISYPTGAKHVFCYAYYVVPPPTSGTIVVRKTVDDPSATATTAFPFQGDISYTSDQRFAIAASAATAGSATFYRAAGQTWSWRELDLPGWMKVGLSCRSTTGASQTRTDPVAGAVSVDLAAGDTVTCTHTDRPVPPPAGLLLSKLTRGAIGSFDFDVSGPDQRSQTIATTQPGAPVAGQQLTLTPGAYDVAERPPAPTPAGSWSLARVTCDGRTAAIPLTVTVVSGKGTACQFTNVFTAGGSITLRKRTEGAAGAADFVVRPLAEPGLSFEQRAVTAGPGQTAVAEGDDTSALALGRYEIVEIGPGPRDDGHWSLESVLCDGAPVGSAQGRTVVTLGEADPSIDCTFVNRFSPTPEPENPSAPSTPDADVAAQGDVGPLADLSVTKSVAPHLARTGATLHYTIVVRNAGPGTAYDVVAAEVDPLTDQTLGLHTTKGNCRGTRPARCAVGTLRRGQRATVTVDVPASRLGRTRNRVAVTSSTSDPDLRNNRADALVSVLPPLSPRFTG